MRLLSGALPRDSESQLPHQDGPHLWSNASTYPIHDLNTNALHNISTTPEPSHPLPPPFLGGSCTRQIMNASTKSCIRSFPVYTTIDNPFHRSKDFRIRTELHYRVGAVHHSTQARGEPSLELSEQRHR